MVENVKKHKITFTKITEENMVAGVGTAGNILIVLNTLINIDKGDSLFVDMETNKTINTEKEPIMGSMNAWEYYFDQTINGKTIDNNFDSSSVPIKLAYEKPYKPYFKECVRLRDSFWQNFQIKQYLKEEIETFCDTYLKGKQTLGVQIRLTDMSSNHNVKKFNDYVTKVNEIIKKRPGIEQVFLATDDEKIIAEFTSSISRPAIYLKDIYRATEDKPDVNPYDRCEYIRPDHLFLLGKEVILDVFILSKCQIILKADVSSVSQVATILSSDIEETFFMQSNIELLKTKLKKYILVRALIKLLKVFK